MMIVNSIYALQKDSRGISEMGSPFLFFQTLFHPL